MVVSRCFTVEACARVNRIDLASILIMTYVSLYRCSIFVMLWVRESFILRKDPAFGMTLLHSVEMAGLLIKECSNFSGHALGNNVVIMAFCYLISWLLLNFTRCILFACFYYLFVIYLRNEPFHLHCFYHKPYTPKHG